MSTPNTMESPSTIDVRIAKELERAEQALIRLATSSRSQGKVSRWNLMETNKRTHDLNEARGIIQALDMLFQERRETIVQASPPGMRHDDGIQTMRTVSRQQEAHTKDMQERIWNEVRAQLQDTIARGELAGMASGTSQNARPSTFASTVDPITRTPGEAAAHRGLLKVISSEEIDHNKSAELESLQRELQDVYELNQAFNSMLQKDAETLRTLEERVEGAESDVERGTQSLLQASKFKFDSLSFAAVGALCGGLFLGAPLALMVGIKGVTGMAVCMCAGAAGGSVVSRSVSRVLHQGNIDAVEEATHSTRTPKTKHE